MGSHILFFIMTCPTALIVTIFLSLTLAQSPSDGIVSLTPSKLVANQITASSVQLSWQRPGGKLSHEIKEYKVLYSTAGQTEKFVMTMSSEPLYTLTGLSPATTYEVWVVPLTTDGKMGEESNRLPITTSAAPDANSSTTPSTNLAAILASSIMLILLKF